MATILYLQQSTCTLPASNHELEYLLWNLPVSRGYAATTDTDGRGKSHLLGVYDKTPVLVRHTVRKSCMMPEKTLHNEIIL